MTILMRRIIRRIIRGSITIISATLSTILNMGLPEFKRFIRIVTRNHRNRGNRSRQIRIQFQHFVTGPFFTRIPREHYRTRILGLLPVNPRNQVAINGRAMGRIIRYNVADLSRNTSDGATRHLFFHHMPVRFPQPFRRILPTPNDFNPYFHQQTTTKSGRRKFSPFRNQTRAQQSVNINRRMERLINMGLLKVRRYILRRILTRVKLNGKHVSRMPSIQIFIFRTRLNPRDVTTDRTRGNSIIQSRHICHIFGIPFPIVPRSRTIVFTGGTIWFLFSVPGNWYFRIIPFVHLFRLNRGLVRRTFTINLRLFVISLSTIIRIRDRLFINRIIWGFVVILSFNRLLLRIIFSFFRPHYPTLIQRIFRVRISNPRFHFVLTLGLIRMGRSPTFYVLNPTIGMSRNLRPIFLTTIGGPVGQPFLVNLTIILMRILRRVITRFFLEHHTTYPRNVHRRYRIDLRIFPTGNLL